MKIIKYVLFVMKILIVNPKLLLIVEDIMFIKTAMIIILNLIENKTKMKNAHLEMLESIYFIIS